ncbi:tubulin monoglycylase TTLL3-like isoform X1, partial [Arapaima gigas]
MRRPHVSSAPLSVSYRCCRHSRAGFTPRSEASPSTRRRQASETLPGGGGSAAGRGNDDKAAVLLEALGSTGTVTAWRRLVTEQKILLQLPVDRGDPQRENPTRRNTESGKQGGARHYGRSLLSLPVINPERLRTAKALVDKAVKLKKVYSVLGPYPVVRAALRARGWVERYLPRPTPQTRHPHGDDDDDDGDNRDDSDDNDDGAEEVEKQDGSDDTYDLMSRLVRNETTYFYWTMRRDSIDSRMLRKEQMINHYAKAGTFTTK